MLQNHTRVVALERRNGFEAFCGVPLFDLGRDTNWYWLLSLSITSNFEDTKNSETRSINFNDTLQYSKIKVYLC